MNKFEFSGARPPGWFASFIVPLAVPIAVFLVGAYVIPVAFLMPLALVILLCYLAMRLSPPAVAFWMVVYIAFVIGAGYIALEPPPISPVWRPLVRAGFVLAGGLTAFLLAGHRVRMRKSNAALFKIISVLPSAVIVSDVSGNINLMNDRCQRLLEGQLDPLCVNSFFSTFITREEQGREIERYLTYFESKDGGPFPATIHTRGDRPLDLEVVITIVTLDRVRYAVTVIEKAEGAASRSNVDARRSPLEPQPHSTV